MADDITPRIEAMERRLGRGINRGDLEKHYREFDLDAAVDEASASLSYEVLDPEQGKQYDPDIETYSYVLKRDGEVSVFQPHDPSGEGFTLFASAGEAEASAKRQIETMARADAEQRRDAEFARTME